MAQCFLLESDSSETLFNSGVVDIHVLPPSTILYAIKGIGKAVCPKSVTTTLLSGLTENCQHQIPVL